MNEDLDEYAFLIDDTIADIYNKYFVC